MTLACSWPVRKTCSDIGSVCYPKPGPLPPGGVPRRESAECCYVSSSERQLRQEHCPTRDDRISRAATSSPRRGLTNSRASTGQSAQRSA